MSKPRVAKPLDVAEWLNTDQSIDLPALRGRIVLVEAFQMLCPGCVSHGLPQAKRVAEAFGREVTVLGLHTVFEHHDAQGSRAALEAFLHEYRIGFPVAIDRQANGGPATMRAYGMQGTPTQVLIDQQGRVRAQRFGHVPDLQLGADIGALMSEPRLVASAPEAGSSPAEPNCDEAGCRV